MSNPEPIAIVGMACRFGTISSLADLWKLLIEGRCALGPVPPDRFPIDRYYHPEPGSRGRVVTREGGYLEDIQGFDARFFRISPREAAAMDPQQRFLLEVGWNALQDAGLSFEKVDGARAGVFVGLFTSDYRERQVKRPDLDLDVYSEIGTTRSSTAGRLAYAFNLTGPAVAVDAACASSLVAVHLACRSIWSGETSLALAGGSNVILEPDSTISFSRSKMLSPRSRCRFGDAGADGFVRSEGVGVVVLKPLHRALEDQDRIYAVIRATGCNNDARQGGGLFMTPGREGQMCLLRRVYDENGISLDRLAFVEAHGTGTRAGDPVECGAIAAVLGSRRTAPSPLYLGSVKTNIGHTEGAAGVASLIKTALSLHHRLLPASLHHEVPNPDIPWKEGRIEVPTRSIPLADRGPVLAGVSSFGLSGTNAHAVLETWDEASAVARTSSDAFVLPLSAHMPAALRAQAARFHALLSDPAAPALPDLCHTAATRRSHLEYRLAVVGASREELRDALAPFKEGGDDEAAPVNEKARTVFVFPGQGGQWVGMGRALLELEPAFRRALERIDGVFIAQQGWSVLALLQEEAGSWATEIERIQPLLFAVQVALAGLWREYGVVPHAVVGHSLGEVAAAHVAGALDLEDAVRVICTRSRCLGRIRGKGMMAVVGLDLEGAAEAIRGHEAQVSIAVSNARTSTVLAGDPAALEAILAGLTARGVYCSRVDVDVASHSPQTEGLLETLGRELADIRPRPGQIPFYSTVDAQVRPGETLDAAYWAANMRRSVRFLETTRQLLRDGYEVFVEQGPHPVLINPIQQTLREEGARGIAVGSMRRDEHHRRTFLGAAAALYMYGLPVHWSIHAEGRQVSLPDYPFQHEQFWFITDHAERAEAAEVVASSPSRLTRTGEKSHPLLPRYVRLGSTPETSIWEVPLSTKRFPFLADHRVRGSALLPGAAFVEIALAAAAESFGERRFALEELELRDYLAVPTGRERALQVQLRTLDPLTAELRFFSFEETPGDDRPPRQHAVARVRLEPEQSAGDEADPAAGESAEGLRAARLLERVGIELARARHNPGYRFAILSLFIGPAPDGVPALSSVELTRRLRALVRHHDLVQPVGVGQFVIVLKHIGGAGALHLVARRLTTRLLEGLDTDGSASRRPLLILGDLVAPKAEPGEVVGDALVGRLPLLGEHSPDRVDPATIAPPEQIPGAGFYERMEQRGISYGPAFRPVRGIERRGESARAELVLPEAVVSELGEYRLHPAALDGCFQAAVAAFIDASGMAAPDDTLLPVGIRRLTLLHPPAGRLYCRSWYRGPGDRDDELEIDFEVSDEDRQVCLTVEGFRVRLFERHSQLPAHQPCEDWLYRWTWQEENRLRLEPRVAGCYLVVEESEAVGRHLQARLEARGATVIRLAAGPDTAGLETSIEAALHDRRGALAGLVYLCAPPAPVEGSDGPAMLEACADRCANVAALARCLAAAGGAPAALWLVTAGAWRVREADRLPGPDHAPLWGLGRVIANESPEIDLRLVDLGPESLEADLTALADTLVAPDGEDEVALRDGRRLVHRLGHGLNEGGEPRSLLREVDGQAPFALAVKRAGRRSVPVWRGAKRAEPPSGEIELRVHAAVLEPGAVLRGADLVAGCSGVVTGVGAGVRDLKVGDTALAFLTRPAGQGDLRIGRYTHLPRPLASRIPGGMTFVQAATLVAYGLPAWLALHGSGRLPAGSRVFIRSAAAGVGLAAALIAHTAGARVYTTATRLEDRDRLRALGLTCVMDEGSDELVEELLDLTGREGVDLVINLGGVEGIRQGLAVLAPGGRMVDVGHAEGGAGRRLELEGAPANVSFASIDLAELARRRHAPIRSALRELIQRCPPGLVQQLAPFTSITPDRLPALEAAALSGAPGLPVALSFDAATVRLEEPLEPGTLFEKQGTYLITGGTGGLGQLLARWLARRGAGHIALLSRRGDDGGLEELRTVVREAGAGLSIVQGDVVDFGALEAAIVKLERTAPPLRGVFHLAGVLDDATLDRQDRARFLTAMRPKVVGGWNLHRLTAGRPLTHFVLFASAASTLGSPGQANYAAANAFLEALAHHRRGLGLPALSLDWGTWAEAGLAVAREDRAARLESRGMAAMSSEDSFRALEAAMLQGSDPAVAVFNLDWGRWARSFPRTTKVPRVAHLVPASQAEQSADTGNLTARIAQAEAGERRKLLETWLRQQLADVLRMPASRLSMSTPLAQLGMDSLMTVELRSRLRDQLKVELSPSRILAMANPAALADAVVGALQPAPVDPGRARVNAPDESMPVVHLDGAIRAAGEAPPVRDPRAVFLTGATGFLGAHLLRELLDRTTARVYCLVRADDVDSGRRRIKACLEDFGLWRAEDAARLVPVVGDLEQPGFGLAPDNFLELARSVDVLYHCGAWVHHLYPYERLVAANVRGTEEVLRLAVADRPLPVHHVSTLAVFPFTPDPMRAVTFDEEAPLEPACEPFFSGYSQSKWAAERLIEQARARGLNVCVYRAGAITGSRHAGICPESDVIWRVIQAAVTLGQAPHTRQSFGLTPVDAVAGALVALSRQPESVNRNFHLNTDRPVTLAELVAGLEALGYSIRLTSFEAWRKRLSGGLEHGSAIAPLVSKLLEIDFEKLDRMRIVVGNQRTLERLEPALRAAMGVDRALLMKYLERLVETGFLPSIEREREELEVLEALPG